MLEPEAAAVSDPTLTPAAVAEAKVVARMREQRRSFVPESAQLDSCDLQVLCVLAHLIGHNASSTRYPRPYPQHVEPATSSLAD